MDIIGDTFRRAIDALLLRDDAYEAMRDSPDPFRRGFVFILVVGVVVVFVHGQSHGRCLASFLRSSPRAR